MLPAVGAIALALLASAAEAESYAVQAGWLIVDAALPERSASTVIVTDGQISRVKNSATAPVGAIVSDMRDKTVMPGLIDVHADAAAIFAARIGPA